MTRKWFHSLTILVMAFFAGQSQPLTAQLDAANGGNSSEFHSLLQESSSRVPTRVVVREADASHSAPVASGMAKVKTYKFRSVDYPGGSAADIWDFDHGTAVGDYDYGDGSFENIAFYLHGKTYKTLSVPGAVVTGVAGINASGQMVGNYTDSANNGHGFLYTGSSFVAIDYPQSLLTAAEGISDQGVVVGAYLDSSDNYHGFVDKNGSLTSLDFPGATSSAASGINSSGDIVGIYSTSDEHGFLLRKGIYTTIDFPSSSACHPGGINDAGEIAGWFEGQGHLHGFTYSNGVYSQVDVPGASATGLYRIKNDGTVTGVAIDVLGERHGIVGH